MLSDKGLIWGWGWGVGGGGWARRVPSITIHTKLNIVIVNRKKFQVISGNTYLFKDNDRNIRKRREKCSKLTIKTPERRQSHLFESSC